MTTNNKQQKIRTEAKLSGPVHGGISAAAVAALIADSAPCHVQSLHEPINQLTYMVHVGYESRATVVLEGTAEKLKFNSQLNTTKAIQIYKKNDSMLKEHCKFGAWRVNINFTKVRYLLLAFFISNFSSHSTRVLT